MIYEEKNGLKCCKEGWVLIEGIRHYIKDGFVICNPNLNSRAWNVTESEGTCLDCLSKIELKQLKLF